MADIDIDPFGEHESRPEETGENIPLDLVTPGRSSTWEPDRGESQRTKLIHLEENLKELNSGKIMLKIYIKSYQKTLVKPQNYFAMIILNSKAGNYTTQAIKSP